MSYIGNPIVSTNFPKDTFSGNGSTTAFTMSIAPASVNAVIVVVSGITQDPSTYTISGTTLTFSGAPPTGTSNISVRHLGIAGIPNVPADASVTTAKLANGNLFSQWATSGSNINYTAGNVSIGSTTTRSSAKFDVLGDTISFGSNADYYGRINYDAPSGYLRSYSTDGGFSWIANSTERMRITLGGELLWGCTATSGSVPTTSGIAFAATASAYDNALYFRNGADPTYVLDFYNTAGSRAGKVTVNSSTTSYDTSSDYRLKENVEPMVNALSTVAQLKPVTYTWKSTNEDGQGFIAHELQAIVPDAVTGVKDGIDAHGNPDYQGVDASFLIATLTAAIQEQQAMIQTQQAAIEELTTRVTALETV